MAYDHALKKLEKMSINTTVKPDKVLDLVKQQTRQITELQARYKQIDSRVNELNKAQDIVQKIIKPQREESKNDIKKEKARTID